MWKKPFVPYEVGQSRRLNSNPNHDNLNTSNNLGTLLNSSTNGTDTLLNNTAGVLNNTVSTAGNVVTSTVGDVTGIFKQDNTKNNTQNTRNNNNGNYNTNNLGNNDNNVGVGNNTQNNSGGNLDEVYKQTNAYAQQTPVDIYSYYGALQSKGGNFVPVTNSFSAFGK